MPETTARTAAVLLLVALSPACDTFTDPPTPASIEIVAESDVLVAGETSQLQVNVLDADAQPLDAAVSFTSSAPGVLAVDPDGLVSALAPGTAQITAHAGSVSDQVTIQVTEAPAAIELSSPVDVLPADQTAQLDVAAVDADGAPIPDAPITFTADPEARVSIDENGLVTGETGGEVEIIASAGDAAAAVALFVFEAEDYCTTGLVLPPALPVRTALQSGDCTEIFGNGAFVDLWFMEFEQETTVTIDMTSDDFNTYLVLEDDEINLVAEDDDGGQGTNARIIETLPAGGYWILTTSSQAGQSGVYTIVVDDGSAGDLVRLTPVRAIR